MDIEKMKKLWQCSANAPTVPEAEQIKAKFTRDLRSRYRRFILFLIWVFSALSFATGLVFYQVLVTHKVTLETDWAVLPLLAIPWLFAIRFLAQFRKHNRAHSSYGESIVLTLRAAMDENRLACLRIKRLAWIYLLSAPALALAIHQLKWAGKMNESEVTSMLLLFGVTLITAGGWAAFRYFRKLLPQRAEIIFLLRDYEGL